MILLLAAIGHAATLTVPGDYPTLPNAVDAALPGDEIEVGPGVWVAGLLIDKDLTIRSTDGAAATVIQSFEPLRETFAVVQANLVLDDLSVQCSPAGAVSLLDGNLDGVGLRFHQCASATPISAVDGVNGVSLGASRFTSLPTSTPAIDTAGATLTLDDVLFEDATPGNAPLVQSSGGTWQFTDVEVRDVHRSTALFEGSDLVANWTRVGIGCSSAGDTVVSLAATSASLGPVMVWNTTTAPGGALMELGASGSWSLEFSTLIGAGAVEHVRAVSGLGRIESTSFSGAGLAVAGQPGSAVQGDWNAFDAGVAPAGGYANEAQVRGSSSVDGDPLFEALDPEGNCTGDILAPQLGSPLVDAGNPSFLDRDGSRADIGATGGPDGFALVGDDRDGDGAPDGLDCEPLDPAIFPGAFDVPYDGIDQDCDGADVTDVDGDGAAGAEVGGPDCDDEDPSIGPHMSEDLGPVDRDCDGHTDPTTPIKPVGCQTGQGPGGGWTVFIVAAMLGPRRKERHP